MPKTLRKYQSPSSAGQIVWLLDLDPSNSVTTPTGYIKLSTTTTTTITNAQTLYPQLYASYTSTSASSPVYRSGSNIIVQKIYGFPKRTKTCSLSFTSINFSPYVNTAIFYTDGSMNGWKMNFHVAGSAGVNNPSAVIANISLIPQAVPINCETQQWGVYPARHQPTALIDQYAGCRMWSNTGDYAEQVAFWGEVAISEPTAYLSASVMETPNMTPFMRLYNDIQ
jgi:hypothetical protein